MLGPSRSTFFFQETGMQNRVLSPRVLVRVGLALALAPAVWATALADEQAPELRYRWKTGQAHVYQVNIEADYGDYTNTLSGNATYQVGAADQDGAKLTFRGGLTEKTQLKPGVKGILIPRPRFPGSAFTGVGAHRSIELTVNDRGEVVSTRGSSQLPYLLGNLSELALERLPKDQKKTWSIPHETAIVLSDGHPRPRMSAQDDRAQIKATEETTYTIDKVEADTVTITRRYELKTAETIMGKPRFEIVGEGKLTFDRKLGCATKLEAQQKIVHREATKTTEIPLKITYRLLTEKEKADLAKTPEGAPLFPGEPLTDDLQKQALEDLKSGDRLRTIKALALLQTKEPAADKPNKEIAKALEEMLADKEATTRFSAARALVKWATPDSVPALTKALGSEDTLVRHGVMEALGKLKAESAAEAITKRMPELQDRLKARQALEALGPAAEPAVLKMAEHSAWEVRSEVCTVLEKIGTQKSVATLTTMQQGDANALVKIQAKKALDAIEKRK
jgi:hypothetical protein